jgi:hypothetical protein
MPSVITCSIKPSALIVSAPLSLSLLNEIAEAYTTHKSELDLTSTENHIRNTFGKAHYRWHTYDCSAACAVISFSNRANPKVLTYNNQVVQFASADAEPFKLYVREALTVKPHYKNHKASVNYIGTL